MLDLSTDAQRCGMALALQQLITDRLRVTHLVSVKKYIITRYCNEEVILQFILPCKYDEQKAVCSEW